MNDTQIARRLEKALGDDARTNELGIHIRLHEGRLVAFGEVASPERRDAVLGVLHELEPDLAISDQLTISADAVGPPTSHERIRSPHS